MIPLNVFYSNNVLRLECSDGLFAQADYAEDLFAVLAGERGGEGVFDTVEDAEEIDIQEMVPLLVGVVGNVAGDGDGGVVEQDINASVFSEQDVESCLHLIAGSDVTRQGKRFAALRVDGIGRGFELVRIAGDHADDGPFTGEGFGDFLTDALGGTGDEGDFVCEAIDGKR
jgi:hypothetical protein